MEMLMEIDLDSAHRSLGIHSAENNQEEDEQLTSLVRSNPTSSLLGRHPHLTFGHSSVTGCDGYTVSIKNQDSYIQKPIKMKLMGSKAQQCMLFGVLDGHGPYGEAVSHYVSKKLHKSIVQAAEDPQLRAPTLEPMLWQAFHDCDEQLANSDSGINCELSGTSCVLALFTGSRLTVCNLGDSKCILGKVMGSGDCSAFEMSNDHTPALLAEATRVMACGGRVASYMSGPKHVGPLRVWLPDKNAPGLSITRSFGDHLAKTVGVIAEPEVLEYDLEAEDKYLVLVSDGVADMIDSDEIVQFVHGRVRSKQNVSQIAEDLVKEARGRWRAADLGVIDDCTALVVIIGPMRNSTILHRAGVQKPRTSIFQANARPPSTITARLPRTSLVLETSDPTVDRASYISLARAKLPKASLVLPTSDATIDRASYISTGYDEKLSGFRS
eukprot:gene21266-28186_t